MTKTMNFVEWYDDQFNMTKEEVAAMRQTADALLKNPQVMRIFAQMEANAVGHMANGDPADPSDLATRVIMVQAVRALPRVLAALVEDKKFDKASKERDLDKSLNR